MKYTVIVKDNAIYNVTDTYEVEANSKEEAIEQIKDGYNNSVDSFEEFLDYMGNPIYTVYEGI